LKLLAKFTRVWRDADDAGYVDTTTRCESAGSGGRHMVTLLFELPTQDAMTKTRRDSAVYRCWMIGTLSAALLAAGWAPLDAQNSEQQRLPYDWPLAIANILPTGQPVIPIFESFIPKPDGTTVFSFGYINLNSKEEVDIPLGPDNFLEPRTFDGVQPTHFDVAPKERERMARHQSVFQVTVPKGFKGDVVWTLRMRGETYSSPARAKSSEYWVDDLQGLTFAPLAPILKFGPDGPAGRGRSAFIAGPITVPAGKPSPVSIIIDLLSRPVSTVTWYHHQGAGKVTFAPREVVVKAGGDVKTLATFSQPGDYLLRVTALESLSALEQHCCYTNGYIKVSVTE
jgi:hypothetical protein